MLYSFYSAFGNSQVESSFGVRRHLRSVSVNWIDPDLFQNWISRFANHFRDIANARVFVQTSEINRPPVIIAAFGFF